jgi:hypothetical protein
MKRSELTYEYFRDWWLKKYHNTNSAEVIKNHPEESKSGEWFELYPCTQEQGDEWKKWAKQEFKKAGIRTTGMAYALMVLDCSPKVTKK